jgi:predicted enzyme related to lactoylglutathione lyase
MKLFRDAPLGGFMIRKIDGILLSSPDAKKLSEFYRDKLGLKIGMEAEMGDGGDKVYGFGLTSGSDFVVMDHSKVKGKSMQPERYMINFEVDDIEADVKRLKEVKVKLVSDIYHIEEYGQVATFEDPDGNYFQLVQIRAKRTIN